MDTKRLWQLHLKAKSLLDQLDAMAAECCEIAGFDEDATCIDADRCRDIVFQDASPDFVIAELRQRKRAT